MPIQGIHEIVADICNTHKFDVTEDSIRTLDIIMETILKIIATTSHTMYKASFNTPTTVINKKTLINTIRVLFAHTDTFMVNLLATCTMDHMPPSKIDFEHVRLLCTSTINSKVSRSYVLIVLRVLEYLCRELVAIAYTESLIESSQTDQRFIDPLDPPLRSRDIFTAIRKDPDFRVFFNQQHVKILDAKLIIPKKQINSNIREYICREQALNVKISNKAIQLLQKYIESRLGELLNY
jgi:hypothetical protein